MHAHGDPCVMFWILTAGNCVALMVYVLGHMTPDIPRSSGWVGGTYLLLNLWF